MESGIYVPNDKLCKVIIDVLNSTRRAFKFLFNGYVIMLDHLHLVLTTAENKFSATRREGEIAENEFIATRGDDKSVSMRVGEDSSSPPENNISEIMKAIKGKSARIINKILGKSGQLWQHSFYEHGVRNDLDYEEKMNYVHYNPARANLVKDPAGFKYSNYRNYYQDDNSIIEVDIS